MAAAKLLLFVLLCPLAALASGGGSEKPSEEAHEDASANHDTPATSPMTERPARQSSRDIKIPIALVARIEKAYREFLKTLNVSDKEPIKRRFLNTNVEMTQKRAAALHEDVRVLTPLGGGVIDLSEFVTPLRGAFHVKINARKEDGSELVQPEVYFVSRAKTRRIAGQDYGDGCAKFMGVSKYFNKKMGRNGFEVYTADLRYLSVLGGTFVLVAFDKEALHVGSVTFMDSRHPELLCE